MRGLSYGLMAVFSSLSIVGLMFKMMHWPGAGILFVVGMIGLALVAIPTFTVYKLKS